MSHSIALTAAQREVIHEPRSRLNASAVWVERDEPHDSHVFISFQLRDSDRSVEFVIDADGSFEE